MALECVCFVTDGSQGGAPQRSPKHCEDPRAKQQPGLRDIDLCAIVRKSEDEHSRHNDYECHQKGEKRQNLINKIKMFLDDYDDRPVMKGKSKAGDSGKALGQSGYGPLIKYPGYVDYDHPYFSNPYNKMPDLAMTVGQRGQNPCPPTQVRNWDECHKSQAQSGAGGAQDLCSDYQDSRCHCAERRDEVARCPAAGVPQQAVGVQAHQQGVGVHSQQAIYCNKGGYGPPSQAQASYQYICIPLPDDC